MKGSLSKKTLLGVGITSATQREVLQYIITSLEEQHDPYYIVTPNPEIIVLANKRREFLDILNQARIALPDGSGVTLAAQFLGKPLSQRITGVDLMDSLCEDIAKKPITVGFLGGRDGVAERTAECLMARYPGLKVAFVGEEWDHRLLRFPKLPRSPMIDILFVAFGFPKQEEWMAEHVGKVPVRVMMGVGGAFDYISGEVPRAPRFLRSLGLEWLFRLLREPWRWRRQLSLLTFIWIVLRERMRADDSAD